MRLYVIGALTGVVTLAGTTGAHAETRTATIQDGPDPTVLYDIERVTARFDRAAASVDVHIRLNHPLPSPGSDTSYGSLSVTLVSTLGYDDKCSAYGSRTSVGDTSIRIAETGYGTTARYEATTNVNFRLEHPALPLQITDDRQGLSVSVTDGLYAQFNPRCLSASGSGRGAYDAAQPGGGPTADAVEPVFFEGYGPPPTCSNGKDDDYDGFVDLVDPGCLADARQAREDNAVPACGDKRDNDYDRRVDLDDPGCLGDPAQTSENNALPVIPECRDTRDNDADGLVDVADPNCNGDPDAFSESSPLALAAHSPELIRLAEAQARTILRARLGSRWTGVRRRSVRCSVAGELITCRIRGSLRRGPLRLRLVLQPNNSAERPALSYRLAGSLPRRGCRQRCTQRITRRGSTPVLPAMLRSTGTPPAPSPDASSTAGSGNGLVHVDGYYRKDGTYVRPHTRQPPSRSR